MATTLLGPPLRLTLAPICTRGRILAGLVRIAAHHITTWLVWLLHGPLRWCVVDCDLLDLKLHRVGALTRPRRCRTHRCRSAPRRALPWSGVTVPRECRTNRAPRPPQSSSSRSFRRRRPGTPDAPRSDFQALSHLVERGDVGGVAGPHLVHTGMPSVNHHPQYHLLQSLRWSLLLPYSEGVATVAGEEQRGGVEEHQVERAGRGVERTAPPRP